MSQYEDAPAKLANGKFAKGNSGKPVGALSVVGKVNQLLNQMGFNPIEEAVKRYRDPETPNASKDYCLGLITDRCLPKLKAVEVTGANGADMSKVLINIVAGLPTNPSNEAIPVNFSESEEIDAQTVDAIEQTVNIDATNGEQTVFATPHKDD